ncbi:MAG: hypothetical protein IJO14_07055 [Clostridia bacterium]|nr:hypothetical protein [Clostridia bacterium]
MLYTNDILFLGDDLSNTAEIKNEVNRAQAFIQLDKWDRAEEIFSELADKHPESPCGWFGLARVLSLDFTKVDLLEKRATIKQFEQIKQYIQYCEKTADDFRKDEYTKLFTAYSYLNEKCFAEICRNKFVYVIEALEEAEKVSAAGCPQNKSIEQYVIESLGILLHDLVHDKTVEFYNYDYHRMVDIGKRFPSVALVVIHRSIIEEFLQTYHYRHKKKDPNYTLTYAITDYDPNIFKNAEFDTYAADMLRVFPRFLKALRIKIGDVQTVVPQEYYKLIAMQYKNEPKVKVVSKGNKKKKNHLPIVLFLLLILLALGFTFFTEPSFVESASKAIPVATPIFQLLGTIFTTVQDFIHELLRKII